jgi:hypothetical protein
MGEESIGTALENGESIFQREYFPKETCAEKVIGRCRGCSISNPGIFPDSENCLNYQPARIEIIK